LNWSRREPPVASAFAAAFSFFDSFFSVRGAAETGSLSFFHACSRKRVKCDIRKNVQRNQSRRFKNI